MIGPRQNDHEDPDGRRVPEVIDPDDRSARWSVAAIIRRGAGRWWIAVLGISLATLGLAWVLASPLGASPDDEFHLASIWCSPTAPDQLCGDRDDDLPEGNRPVLVPAPVGPGAACFAFDSSSSAWCQRVLTSEDSSASRANDGLYPGGYYTLMGFLVTGHPVLSALAMRGLTWVIAIGLMAAAAAVARPPLRQAYVVAVLVTSVPLGIFLFASNNPSGTAIPGVSAFWCAALAFMQSRDRREAWAAGGVAGVAALVALQSRADAGLYVAASVGCVVVVSRGWLQGRRGRAGGLLAVALVAGVSMLSSGQATGATSGTGAPKALLPWTSTLWHNVVNLPSLWSGSLGGQGLGWMDTRMPEAVVVAMLAVTGGLAFASLVSWDRVKLLAAGIVAVPLTIVPLYILDANHRRVGEFVQPRYLLPLLPVMLALMLLPAAGRHAVRLHLTQLRVIGVLIVVAHSLALHANIRRYVTGQDVLSPNLDDKVEWWWEMPVVRPLMVWIVGSIAFAVVVHLCLAHVLAPGPSRPAGPSPAGGRLGPAASR